MHRFVHFMLWGTLLSAGVVLAPLFRDGALSELLAGSHVSYQEKLLVDAGRELASLD